VAHSDEFLSRAPTVPVRTDVETFELKEANDALDRCNGVRYRVLPCC
jgi:hypothetical protein